MSLTPEQIQHMDSLSGLSMNQMDQVINGTNSPTLTNRADSFIDSTLGKIPGIGGIGSWLAKGVTDPVTDYADTFSRTYNNIKDTAQTNPQQAGEMVKQAVGTGNVLSDLITGQGMARSALPVGLDAASLVATPGMAKGAVDLAGQAPRLAQLATKKGVGKAITQAAQKATDEGVNIKWDEMAKEIRDAVTGKLGGTKEVKQALNSLLSEKTPAQVGTPSLNPNELLQWRQQIAARGAGKGVFQNLFKGTDIEDKVNSEARRVISQNLKGLAPDITTPDKLYSFYSKLGGDIPTWAARIVGLDLAGKLFGGQVKGLVKNLVQ